ncbi:SOS cell division inhibitor [Marinobacter sp. SS5-14b]|uniref:SOS cell division inhibitor n=1 Tax=Marinobacter sp. SS5-14b TaxID=3050456 RepID=UPI0026DFAA41|nr:SOS cell division inhibitor [Marinobacter sp. SS5-14b]
MANSESLLAELDHLQTLLQDALKAQDWDALAELNNRVKPAVEPLMMLMEHGEVEPSLVKERLESLNRFVAEAEQSATRAREEARQSLRGVSKNRTAAKAYENVSSGRPK